MGWFDEQIKQRMAKDQQVFEESYENFASIFEKHAKSEFNEPLGQGKNAIEQILQYFHIHKTEDVFQFQTIEELLEYQLRPYGIMKRHVKLDKQWYRSCVGVMLAKTKNDDIVALIPQGIKGYKFYDHHLNKFVSINKRNADIILPEALYFYKSFPSRKINLKDILKYIFQIPAKAEYIMMLFVIIALTLAGMIIPPIYHLFFSDIIETNQIMRLLMLMMVYLCVKLSHVLFTTIHSIYILYIQTKIQLTIESATMMRLFTLPSKFFKMYSIGEIFNRLNQMKKLSKIIAQAIFSIGFTSIFSLIYIGQIFSYAPTLVIPALSVILILFIYTIINTWYFANINEQRMALESKEQALSYGLINGISKIKLAGAEKRVFSKWSNTFMKAARKRYNLPWIIKYQQPITIFISGIGMMLLYYYALEAHLSVADYMAFLSAYGMVNGAFLLLSDMISSFADIKPILQMVKPILETVPEVQADKKVITRLSGAIEISHVNFRYTADTPLILDDLTLKIRAGEYIAIVGATGSGKSTLLRLLLGFEKANRGTIYYDHQDIEKIDLKSLRQRIGVVLQDGKLFQGDIFSNITISSLNATLEDAWKVCEEVGIANDIEQMPMGMNTLIAEGQQGISGGQKQRILIARALCQKPKILMFDEATSALDNISQKIVCDVLDQLKCTRIIVAHRLSTIKKCNRIIVLSKGKIIGDGTYDELLGNNAYFKELVNRQMLSNE